MSEVRKASSISDNEVLYGEMSKTKINVVVYGSILGIVGLVVGSISLYNYLS